VGNLTYPDIWKALSTLIFRGQGLLTLEDEDTAFLRTPGFVKLPAAQLNIPEDENPQYHFFGSLKSR
jgi:hypothetical protein